MEMNYLSFLLAFPIHLWEEWWRRIQRCITIAVSAFGGYFPRDSWMPTFALALYKMYLKCTFGILRGLPAEDTPLHQKVLSTLSVIIWITYHPKPPFQIDGQRRVNLMESEGKLGKFSNPFWTSRKQRGDERAERYSAPMSGWDTHTLLFPLEVAMLQRLF